MVTIRRLRVAYLINKPTCAQLHARARASTPTPLPTHTEICNTYCFPRQQWFRELASMLIYTYIDCPVEKCGHVYYFVSISMQCCFTCTFASFTIIGARMTL